MIKETNNSDIINVVQRWDSYGLLEGIPILQKTESKISETLLGIFLITLSDNINLVALSYI